VEGEPGRALFEGVRRGSILLSVGRRVTLKGNETARGVLGKAYLEKKKGGEGI